MPDTHGVGGPNPPTFTTCPRSTTVVLLHRKQGVVRSSRTVGSVSFMRVSQLLAPPMPGAICNSARTGTHRPDAGLESQGTFHFR